MSEYVNGKVYPFCAQIGPPIGRAVPYAYVEMASLTSMVFRPVLGKMDTGTTRTALDFSTAYALGITNPTLGYLTIETVKTATNQEIDCYVHQVLARVRTAGGSERTLQLYPGFAREIRRNLFGMDWAVVFCIAVDSRKVCLLE